MSQYQWTLTPERVREIHAHPMKATYAECKEADQWVKEFALERLETALRNEQIKPCIQEYVKLHVRVYFGSIETDNLLMKLNCYPAWLGEDSK